MKWAVISKGWAYRVSGGQEVGLQCPRGSRGRPKGSQGSGQKGPSGSRVGPWTYRVPGGKGVGQKGPRGSRGRPIGSQVGIDKYPLPDPNLFLLPEPEPDYFSKFQGLGF